VSEHAAEIPFSQKHLLVVDLHK